MIFHWSRCRVLCGQAPRIVQPFVQTDASVTKKAHFTKTSDEAYIFPTGELYCAMSTSLRSDVLPKFLLPQRQLRLR